MLSLSVVKQSLLVHPGVDDAGPEAGAAYTFSSEGWAMNGFNRRNSLGLISKSSTRFGSTVAIHENTAVSGCLREKMKIGAGFRCGLCLCSERYLLDTASETNTAKTLYREIIFGFAVAVYGE